jgi:hypothetical protein
LKEEDYEIVGHARKSLINENDEDRSRLLKHIVYLLRKRLLVDKVFVSPISQAKESIGKRDIVKHQIMEGTKAIEKVIISKEEEKKS